MKYVEPKGYITPSMKKILDAGNTTKSSTKKPASKSTTKTTKK